MEHHPNDLRNPEDHPDALVSVTRLSPRSYPDVCSAEGYNLGLLLWGVAITDAKSAFALQRRGWLLTRTCKGFVLLDGELALPTPRPEELNTFSQDFDDLVEIALNMTSEADETLLQRCLAVESLCGLAPAAELPSTEEYLEALDAAKSRFLAGVLPRHDETNSEDLPSLLERATRLFGEDSAFN